MMLAAGTTGIVIVTVVAFLIITLVLVSLLLFVKQKLAPSGPVTIRINGEREIEVASGGATCSLHLEIKKYSCPRLVVGVELVFSANVAYFQVEEKPYLQKLLILREKN